MCIPFTVIYTLRDHWTFGDAMCKLSSYMQSVSVSVGRYLMTANPCGWKRSAPHAYWGITLIWLLSLLLPMSFFLSYHPPMNLFTLSLPPNWPSKMKQLVFTTFMLVAQYSVSLTFILICYLKFVICRHRRSEKEDRKRESHSQLNKNKRIKTMLTSTAVTFAACWLPLNIFNVIFDWYHKMQISCHHDLVGVICHLIAMEELIMLIYHCWCFAPQEIYRKCCHLHDPHR
ncbi:unnamed protein product [Nyctereutes procyonoides]|uniref:(raccoon dog) hypothetical protein n=1 Tax=Nyctereutes procyonoides TaxID=34880 RepID=A0A811ZGM5_NYCPR|nr:unnamed protein product [Nyctereutes procyonoides]